MIHISKILRYVAALANNSYLDPNCPQVNKNYADPKHAQPNCMWHNVQRPCLHYRHGYWCPLCQLSAW